MDAILLMSPRNQTWWSLKSDEVLMKDGFQCDIIWGMFLHYLWKGNSQKRTFFQNIMNFESSLNNFGNILFTIAGNIYVNRW